MAKRNQYNRVNFAQLPPMNWPQPTTFNPITLSSGAYLTIPTEQPGLLPPSFTGIDSADVATWPITGQAGPLSNGDRAAQMWFLTNVDIADSQQFFIEFTNAQVTAQSLIFVEVGCATQNGVYASVLAQASGAVLFQVCSNGTTVVGGTISLAYLILNPS